MASLNGDLEYSKFFKNPNPYNISIVSLKIGIDCGLAQTEKAIGLPTYKTLLASLNAVLWSETSIKVKHDR